MPELETKLRAAAPRETGAPAHLEATIWAALSRDIIDAIDTDDTEPLLRGPELVVDDAPAVRRSSRFGLTLGLVAAAAVLIGAVILAGLRSTASEPAGGTTPAPVTTAPAATPAASLAARPARTRS
jgi:hypothetical protein